CNNLNQKMILRKPPCIAVIRAQMGQTQDLAIAPSSAEPADQTGLSTGSQSSQSRCENMSRLQFPRDQKTERGKLTEPSQAFGAQCGVWLPSSPSRQAIRLSSFASPGRGALSL